MSDAIHDLTAARCHSIIGALVEAGVTMTLGIPSGRAVQGPSAQTLEAEAGAWCGITR